MKDVEKLAREFSRQLWLQIGPAKLRHVIGRNRKEASKEVCHSHDFCDANMMMYAAGLDLKLWKESDDVTDYHKLWSDAWDLAKAHQFYGMEKSISGRMTV